MRPEYPGLSIGWVTSVAWSLLRRQSRSMKKDGLAWSHNLDVDVLGVENLPAHGPAVVVMNHYSRPGFQAWWFALALAAAAPIEMHWTMTAAWTDDGTPGAKWRALLISPLLPHLARIYGCTSMPPMPPREHEVEARSRAVRHLLSIARSSPPPVLAIAPEGQDSQDGSLMHPHPGAGRLMALLNDLGYAFTPVSVYETDRLVLSCGAPFRLDRVARSDRDTAAADAVMTQIAARLPAELRGPYAGRV